MAPAPHSLRTPAIPKAPAARGLRAAVASPPAKRIVDDGLTDGMEPGVGNEGGCGMTQGAPFGVGGLPSASPAKSHISDVAGVSASVARLGRGRTGFLGGADSASVVSSATAGKTVGTEDVRSMTLHQKADYWFNNLDLTDAMLGKQDGRPVRQGCDLVQKNQKTSDPTLQAKLEELRLRLGQIALAERLSAGGLAQHTDTEIEEALDAMTALEVQLPTAVQLGLLHRRLRKFNKDVAGPGLRQCVGRKQKGL